MIEDWEIGMLYWNCLKQCNGNEKQANDLVRKKYFDDFCLNKDIHLFLGTTLQFHSRSLNPFVIIGVFVPPKLKERTMTEISHSTLKTDGIQQQSLFDL